MQKFVKVILIFFLPTNIVYHLWFTVTIRLEGISLYFPRRHALPRSRPSFPPSKQHPLSATASFDFPCWSCRGPLQSIDHDHRDIVWYWVFGCSPDHCSVDENWMIMLLGLFVVFVLRWWTVSIISGKHFLSSGKTALHIFITSVCTCWFSIFSGTLLSQRFQICDTHF